MQFGMASRLFVLPPLYAKVALRTWTEEVSDCSSIFLVYSGVVHQSFPPYMGILGVGGVETAALADDAAAQVGHEVLKKIGVKAERVEIDLSGALDHGDGEVTVIVILIGEPVLGGRYG